MKNHAIFDWLKINPRQPSDVSLQYSRVHKRFNLYIANYIWKLIVTNHIFTMYVTDCSFVNKIYESVGSFDYCDYYWESHGYSFSFELHV